MFENYPVLIFPFSLPPKKTSGGGGGRRGPALLPPPINTCIFIPLILQSHKSEQAVRRVDEPVTLGQLGCDVMAQYLFNIDQYIDTLESRKAGRMIVRYKSTVILPGQHCSRRAGTTCSPCSTFSCSRTEGGTVFCPGCYPDPLQFQVRIMVGAWIRIPISWPFIWSAHIYLNSSFFGLIII